MLQLSLKVLINKYPQLLTSQTKATVFRYFNFSYHKDDKLFVWVFFNQMTSGKIPFITRTQLS